MSNMPKPNTYTFEVSVQPLPMVTNVTIEAHSKLEAKSRLQEIQRIAFEDYQEFRKNTIEEYSDCFFKVNLNSMSKPNGD